MDLAQELLNELGSSLENLETKQDALLQFLKDNGTLTYEQYAPYVAQAGKSSNVRWRAAHIRLEHLFSAEREKEERLKEPEQNQKGSGQGQTVENKGQETKSNDIASAQPRTGEAKINTTGDDAAKQSSSAKGDESNEHPTS